MERSEAPERKEKNGRSVAAAAAAGQNCKTLNKMMKLKPHRRSKSIIILPYM